MPPRVQSAIWYHFNVLEGCRGECKYCRRIISTAGGSMSNLKRHLLRRHSIVPLERAPLAISKSSPLFQRSSTETSQQVVSTTALAASTSESRNTESESVESAPAAQQPSPRLTRSPNLVRILPNKIEPTRELSGEIEMAGEIVNECSDQMKAPQMQILNKRDLSKEYEAIGVNIVEKLKRMDSMQALFAESAINSVLKRGLLNSLRQETDICDNQCSKIVPPFILSTNSIEEEINESETSEETNGVVSEK